MISRLWLFGAIIAVPFIGLAAAQGLMAHANSELRSALRKQVPDADPGKIASITLDDFCDGSAPSLNDACREYATFGMMATGAAAAGILGLGLLAVIRAAGYVARRSRSLLLNTFKPGLYVTGAAVISLIAVHAVIAMATIWYLESTFSSSVHTGIIFAIGVGGVAGVATVAKNTFSMVREAKTFVFGELLERDAEPGLYSRIGSLARSLGALEPDHIVVGLDPNFFVTEAHVTCLGSDPRQCCLGVDAQEGRVSARAVPLHQEPPRGQEGDPCGRQLHADRAYFMLRDGVEYHDLAAHHFGQRDRQQLAKRLIQRLRDLGVTVEVKAA